MTMALSVRALVNLLVIFIGVPGFLCKDKPAGRAGLIFWGFVPMGVAVFAQVLLMVTLALATIESVPTHLGIIVVLFSLLITALVVGRWNPQGTRHQP